MKGFLFQFCFIVKVLKGQIIIPTDDCRSVKDNSIFKQKQKSNQRWISAGDWDTELKCDGNEVAVGACSGGGAHGHKDCPGQGY